MRYARVPAPHTFPALRTALLFMSGILCAPRDPAVAWFAAGLLTAGLLLLRTSPRFRAGAPLLARLLLPSLLVVALGGMKMSADRAAMPAIPESLTLRPVTVAGRVATAPGLSPGRLRFLLEMQECDDDTSRIPPGAILAVTVRGEEAGALRISQGMTIALHGTISLPGPERNPGEFNAAGYMAANGIAGSLVASGPGDVIIIDTSSGSWLTRTLIAPLRSAILASADSTIGGEEGEFLKGLLIGDRGGISPETMQAFVTSGVAHVLAVSGSNVAVVALVLGFLTGLARLPRGARAVAVAAGLLFYMELTGGQTPVVRATIMALTFLAGRGVQRRSNAYNSLGLSAIIILILDARQLFDAGFQLSFSAVFGIIHLYPRMNTLISRLPGAHRWQRALVHLIRLSAVSLAATLGTVPVTAAWFGRISVVGLLANIPVVPATGLSVVLGFASVAVSAAGGWAASSLGAVNSVLLHWTLAIARLAATAPWASVDASGLHPAAAIAFCAATGLVFHWREPGGVRVLLPVLLLSLNIIVFVPAGEGRAPGLLRVHFLDVGQGDAILVEFPGGRTMLIDAGPLSPAFDAGERTVLPYLRRRGIGKIDLLVVTHPHSDHLGGVPSLLRHCRVGRLLESGQPVRSSLYAAYVRTADSGGVVPEPVSAGCVLDAGPEARLYVLSPHPWLIDRDTSHAPPNLNNASVALKLQYGEVSMLFAGDAEEDAEAAMSAQYGGFLRSTLLKSGHHGSITSSSRDFLDVVRPGMVTVSVGRRNRFHHPSPEVLERYASRGATVARTDLDGAVIVESDGHMLRRVGWR